MRRGAVGQGRRLQVHDPAMTQPQGTLFRSSHERNFRPLLIGRTPEPQRAHQFVEAGPTHLGLLKGWDVAQLGPELLELCLDLVHHCC